MGNQERRERAAKMVWRDYNRRAMPKTCPFCGALKTNHGHLKHHGYYTGYACRSFFIDAHYQSGDTAPFKQSLNCRIDSRIQKYDREGGNGGSSDAKLQNREKRGCPVQ